MAAEQNTALARRLIDEAWNEGNLDVVDEIVAAEYVHHDPSTADVGTGPDRFKRLIDLQRRAFPDLHITLEDQIAAEDKVVDRWTGSGTHTGEFMGVAATGKEINSSGISIHRIEGGKIAETWTCFDAAGMLRQLDAS